VERAAVSDYAFVTALKYIVKANVLAMKTILQVRRDAIFIQSESSEYYHAENPAAIKPAEIQKLRPLSVSGPELRPPVDSEMFEYLMDNGMTARSTGSSWRTGSSSTASWAIDYYWTNEHRVKADGSTMASGEIFGYAVITKQYYDRTGCR
jgi:hypothetical protein